MTGGTVMLSGGNGSHKRSAPQGQNLVNLAHYYEAISRQTEEGQKRSKNSKLNEKVKEKKLRDESKNKEVDRQSLFYETVLNLTEEGKKRFSDSNSGKIFLSKAFEPHICNPESKGANVDVETVIKASLQHKNIEIIRLNRLVQELQNQVQRQEKQLDRFNLIEGKEDWSLLRKKFEKEEMQETKTTGSKESPKKKPSPEFEKKAKESPKKSTDPTPKRSSILRKDSKLLWQGSLAQLKKSSPSLTTPKASLVKPDDFIRALQANKVLLSSVSALKTALSTEKKEWLIKFINLDGLGAIYKACKSLEGPKQEWKMIVTQAQLINCFKSLLNNKEALDAIIDNDSSSINRLLDLVITTSNVLLKTNFLKIMAALALYSNSGYKCLILLLFEDFRLVVKAFDDVATVKAERFLFVIESLETVNDFEHQCACMSLINALISAPNSLDERMNMRREFHELKLVKLIQRMMKSGVEDEALATQLHVFVDEIQCDSLELETIKQCGDIIQYSKESRGSFVGQITKEDFYTCFNIFFSFQPMKAKEKVIHRAVTMDTTSTDEAFRFSLAELRKALSGKTKEVEPLVSSEEFSPPPDPPPAPTAPDAPIAPPAPTPDVPMPPPAPGGPPPPGGPSLGSTKGVTKAKAHPKTNVKMKSIFWTKIPHTKLPNYWKEGIDDSNVKLLVESIEALFPAQAPKLIEEKKEEVKKPSFISLLDPKRSNGMAIMLSQFKMPLSGLKTAILEGDETKLSQENFEALLKYAPTLDEVEIVRSFDGDITKLARPESFIREIIDIPNYRQKLDAMAFKGSFDFKVAELQEQIEILKLACQQVNGSKKLKRVLEIILACGNYLNSNTTRGAAHAFKFEILTKLADMRSTTNNKITLLHFIIQHVERASPELLELKSDLNFVPKANKVDINFIRSGFDEIKDKIATIKPLVEVPDGTQLQSKIREFTQRAELEESILSSGLENLSALITDFLSNLGEDETEVSEVFSIFNTFLEHFEQARLDNIKAKELAEKQARKKDLAANKTQRSDSETGVGIIDDLFSSIKAGNFKLRRNSVVTE